MGPDHVAGRLVGVIGPEAVDVTPAGRLAASRDHAWLSPVLSARLPERVADVVARPATVAGIVDVVRIAADETVPLTVRGRGTGNYGQAVPLAGGVVVDTTACDRIVDIGAGWATVEPGVSFTKLEAMAGASGQELAMFPSTAGSTIGGFVAGGAGGTGSIENGLLWDGFVRAVAVVPCTPDAVPFAVEGEAVAPYLHAYGTTGVISELTVGLVPRRSWVALWASFTDWTAATGAGDALMAGIDPKPRLLSVDDAALAALVLGDAAAPAGTISLRAVVGADVVDETAAAVCEHGGVVRAVRPRGASAATAASFNHVTLRAKRARPELCHLQVGGPALASQHDAVVGCLPGGGLHLDGLGRHGWGGLLLGTFPGEERLDDAMRALRRIGVDVVDPHTWRLDGPATAAMVEAAGRNDPLGLLNPGKLTVAGQGPPPRRPGPRPRRRRGTLRFRAGRGPRRTSP